MFIKVSSSKGTCVFVSIRESQTGIEKSVSFLVKPSQVLEKATMTSKLIFLNASTQTDDKFM